MIHARVIVLMVWMAAATVQSSLTRKELLEEWYPRGRRTERMFNLFDWFKGDDSSSSEEEIVDSKPNIIVLLADDMGYADIVSYGNTVQEWGGIDDLASEGLRFTNGYVGDSVCTPSRTAFITGRLPIRVGVYGETRVFLPWTTTGLPKDEVTIAETLRDAGYATGMIGKWHLGINEKTNTDGSHLPSNHGFDYIGHNLPFTNSWKCDDTGLHLDYPLTAACYLFDGPDLIQQPFSHANLTQTFIADATNFIKTNKEGPFFLYMAFAHMHTSLFSSAPFTGSSRRGRYGDNLNELHWGVGTIIDTLKNLGIDQNTLVFFFSDHGPHREYCEEGGDAGVFRGGKSLSWEGGFRVPYIVWWPGTIKPGISHEIVSSMDIIQTAADFGGGTLPTDREYDGFSLRNLLLNGGTSPHSAYFFYCKDTLMAARVGSYKAHYHTPLDLDQLGYGEKCDAGFPLEDYFLCNECDGDCVTDHDPPMMFNLDVDPGEAYPLDPTSTEYTTALASITAAVDEHQAKMVPAPPILDEQDMSVTICCDEATNCICNYPPPTTSV